MKILWVKISWLKEQLNRLDEGKYIEKGFCKDNYESFRTTVKSGFDINKLARAVAKHHCMEK